MPKKMQPLMCSICGNPIEEKRGWKLGNNAQPINNGRCCDLCNMRVVLPARLNQIRQADRKLREKHKDEGNLSFDDHTAPRQILKEEK